MAAGQTALARIAACPIVSRLRPERGGRRAFHGCRVEMGEMVHRERRCVVARVAGNMLPVYMLIMVSGVGAVILGGRQCSSYHVAGSALSVDIDRTGSPVWRRLAAMANHVRACVACSVVRGGRSLGIIGCQDGYVYRTVIVGACTSHTIRAIVADSTACLAGPGDGSVYGMPARYIRGLSSSRGNAVTGATDDGCQIERYRQRVAAANTVPFIAGWTAVRDAGERCTMTVLISAGCGTRGGRGHIRTVSAENGVPGYRMNSHGAAHVATRARYI